MSIENSSIYGYYETGGNFLPGEEMPKVLVTKINMAMDLEGLDKVTRELLDVEFLESQNNTNGMGMSNVGSEPYQSSGYTCVFYNNNNDPIALKVLLPADTDGDGQPESHIPFNKAQVTGIFSNANGKSGRDCEVVTDGPTTKVKCDGQLNAAEVVGGLETYFNLTEQEANSALAESCQGDIDFTQNSEQPSLMEEAPIFPQEPQIQATQSLEGGESNNRDEQLEMAPGELDRSVPNQTVGEIREILNEKNIGMNDMNTCAGIIVTLGWVAALAARPFKNGMNMRKDKKALREAIDDRNNTVDRILDSSISGGYDDRYGKVILVDERALKVPGLKKVFDRMQAENENQLLLIGKAGDGKLMYCSKREQVTRSHLELLRALVDGRGEVSGDGENVVAGPESRQELRRIIKESLRG